jgi:hypothetical protein
LTGNANGLPDPDDCASIIRDAPIGGGVDYIDSNSNGGLVSNHRQEKVKRTVKWVKACVKNKYDTQPGHRYVALIDGLSDSNFQTLFGYRWDPKKSHSDETPLDTTYFYKSKDNLKNGQADELGLYVGSVIRYGLDQVKSINTTTGGGTKVS